MTAHAQLKALRDKYTRLLRENDREYGMYPEAAAVQQAKDHVYSLIVEDLEDALRAHEGD